MRINQINNVCVSPMSMTWFSTVLHNVSTANNFVYSLKHSDNIGHERSDWNNSQKVTECHTWPLNGEGSLGCHTCGDTGLSFIMFISKNSRHTHLHYQFLRLSRLGLHTVVNLTYISKSPTPLIYEGCPIFDMDWIVWYRKRVIWTNAIWNTKFLFLKCITVRWFRQTSEKLTGCSDKCL